MSYCSPKECNILYAARNKLPEYKGIHFYVKENQWSYDGSCYLKARWC